MAARLITAPVTFPVTLAEVKAMIRVTDSDEDAVIQSLIDAAVAALDGRSGWLGRAIMSQVWAEDFTGSGPWVLALPDVSEPSLTVTVDGVSVASISRTVTAGAEGPILTLLVGGGDAVAVQYSCQMSAAQLKVAKALIGLLVDYWYANRSAGADPEGLPPAVLALIGSLRWHGV